MSVWQRIAEIINLRSHLDSLLSILDPDHWLPGGKDAAFTVALVALVAKMAVADGVVSGSEVRAFRKMVQVSPEFADQVDWFFDLAQRDVAGFDAYAKKVRRLFADSPESLEHVFDLLFIIAAADGFIHEDELEYLREVSQIFGFSAQEFAQISAMYTIDADGLDPYLVLGLSPDAEFETIKATYRILVVEHHPDRLIAKGVPEELVSIATAKVASYNAAFEALEKSEKAQHK